MIQTTEAPSPIVSTLNTPAELGVAWRDEAFALLDRHFDGVTREQFEHDLDEKNAVLSLRNSATAELTGFSTMLVYQTQFEGSPVSVVCSGDTIVNPAAWNSPALPREWIAAVSRLREDYPDGPLYWLLITSGFRTYRLLSTFWQRFHPRFDVTPTPWEQRLRDHLAKDRFRGRYDAERGIIRFPDPQVLRAHLAGVPNSRIASDPHIAFFACANPDHARGDELVCLCELSENNLTPAGRRMAFGPKARQV